MPATLAAVGEFLLEGLVRQQPPEQVQRARQDVSLNDKNIHGLTRPPNIMLLIEFQSSWMNPETNSWSCRLRI